MRLQILEEQGLKLNQHYASCKIDIREVVADYEIMQNSRYESCTFWYFSKYDQIYKGGIALVNDNTKEIIGEYKSFYKVPKEYMEKQVKETCTNCIKRRLELYI